MIGYSIPVGDGSLREIEESGEPAIEGATRSMSMNTAALK